jgi:hypothetical protein
MLVLARCSVPEEMTTVPVDENGEGTVAVPPPAVFSNRPALVIARANVEASLSRS